MPRKIIQDPNGRRYSVNHAIFLSFYQALGFTEVADEPDRVPDVALPFLNVPDPNGTWGLGTRYIISHPDGRQFAVTYANFVHRYQPLGFTIGRGENGEPAPVFVAPLTYAQTVGALAPVLYWRLGESSGTTAADASGINHPGTIAGTVTYGAMGAIAGTTDAAFTLAGGGASPGTVSLNNGGGLVAGGSISMVAWLNLTNNPSSNERLAGWRTFGSNEFYYSQIGASNNVECRFTNSTATSWTFTVPLSPGVYHCLTMIHDATANTLDLVVDGVAQTQIAVSGVYNDPTGTFRLGGDGNGSTIDEVALFNKAITVAQAQSLYTTARTVAGPLLAAPLWSDEFTGTALSYATDTGGGTWRTKGTEGGGSLATGYKDYAGSSWNISPIQDPTLNPFTVANSVLTITAKRADPAIVARDGTVRWMGGILVSNHLAGTLGTPLTWTYGYFEIRARFPTSARGMFPALWLFSNGPGAPAGQGGAEIDILEVFGNASGQPWVSSYHNNPTPGTGGTIGQSNDDLTQWHRFGLDWTANKIDLYVDGYLRYRLTGAGATWFQGATMGIRLNYAVDPNFASDPAVLTTATDPASNYVYSMNVDYVRYYATLPANLPTGSADPSA